MFAMKNNVIIGINLGDYGSTGNIMRNSLEYASKNGDFDYLIVVPKSEGKPNTFAYFEQNTLLDKIDRWFFHKSIGNPDGLFETRATKKVIKKINELSKQYKHVIVHLHNIHMAFIDFRILFKYLSKKDKVGHIFYTIHDSWPYTGGCYYSYIRNNDYCDKWQFGCRGSCPQFFGSKKYLTALIWELKKKYSLMLRKKLCLLPVSNWIDNEISKSFFFNFKRIVVYGETSIMPLGYRDKNLINMYSLNNKKVVLTVSGYWNDWKGYSYIYKVADKLPEGYIILVVGGIFDTKHYHNIIHIKDIPNDKLNRYYSIADVYMSTSQSESLGLTTCEAQICGVPVVAFGHTAIKETFNNKTGILIGEDNNCEAMAQAIIKIVEEKPFKKEDIINNGNRFSKYSTARNYYRLYLKCI